MNVSGDAVDDPAKGRPRSAWTLLLPSGQVKNMAIVLSVCRAYLNQNGMTDGLREI